MVRPGHTGISNWDAGHHVATANALESTADVTRSLPTPVVTLTRHVFIPINHGHHGLRLTFDEDGSTAHTPDYA